jgi:cytochrome c oxidase assembly protein subunit 11
MKKKKENLSIIFKLITSTHTDLPWEFSSANSTLEIKIGEVTNVEYIVKNLGDKKTSGIATFSYHPNELKPYMIKIDCFCYDTHTLEPGEKRKFVLTMMIDPKVTKDSKTKLLEEGIMQFIFCESENFKQKNS